MKVVFKNKGILGLLLVIGLIMHISMSVFAASKTLSISQVVQAKSLWCWAACGEMVGNYQNSSSPNDQWDIVTHVKGPGYPNDTASYDEVKTAIEYGSDNTVSYTYSDTLSFAEHQTDIDEGNPLVVWMSWNGGGAHVVVCAGYKTSGSTNYLYLIDPIEGTVKDYYKYTALVNGTSIQSGTGKYTKSFYID